MASLLDKVGEELHRFYFAVEKRLPHNRIFERQRRQLYGALSYSDILAHLHETHRFQRYLEIGTDTGASMRVSKARVSVGVDPAFNIREPLEGTFAFHRVTSDAFFDGLATEKFNFVFVDGLHVADQVARDLFNSLRVLAPDGLIAVHDIAPVNRVVAGRRRYTAYWTGDVYRALVPYIEQFPDNVLVLLAPPTGLALIRGPATMIAKLSGRPLPPSGLSYRACQQLIRTVSHKVDTVVDLKRVLAGFYRR